jgi:hypothetical protein
MVRALRVGAPIVGAVLITVIFGSIYAVAQQIERQGANDAPLRLASQLASASSSTGPSTDSAASDRVDLAKSLALFSIVYDSSGAAISGTGYLDGALATLPHGVIDAARATGEDRVTWQPQPGLRFAAVAIASGANVIVAGQSLAPSESRTDALGALVLAAWAGTLALLAVGVTVVWLWRRRTVAT